MNNEVLSPNNNASHQLNIDIVVRLLRPLIEHPYILSFVEERYVDELVQCGFFDMEAFTVTAAGRDFLAIHEPSVFRND